MGCADKGMLVPLALDGELDAEAAVEFEQHLAHCPDCAVDHARLKGLKAALAAGLDRPLAPAALRDRILAALPEPEGTGLHRFRRPGWTATAGLAVGAALAASLATFLLVRPTEEDRLTQEIVSSHVRALASGHLTDLAASEPGTLQPWLAERVASTTPVRDLSKSGYRLAGARLDYLDRDRIVAVVYRRDAHLFTLYVVKTPAARDGESDAVIRQGYAVCHWTRTGLTFWAVSDADPEQLEAFEDAATGSG